MGYAMTSADFRAATLGGPLPPSVTLATRFPAFGYSVARNGGKYHIPTAVLIDWADGRPLHVGARWACGSSTQAARLVHDVPADGVRCATCPHPAAPVGEHVYLVRVGDELKVGHTGNLHQRVRALRGRLLVAVPGGPEVEQQVLASAPEACRGREWFAAQHEPVLRQLLDGHRAFGSTEGGGA